MFSLVSTIYKTTLFRRILVNSVVLPEIIVENSGASCSAAQLRMQIVATLINVCHVLYIALVSSAARSLTSRPITSQYYCVLD